MEHVRVGDPAVAGGKQTEKWDMDDTATSMRAV